MGYYKTDRKSKSFLRDYFGILPLLGGTITAGVACGAAFAIGLACDASKTAAQIMGGANAVDAINLLYQNAGNLAGQYVMPAGAAGQFLTYRFKKSITSFFKK